MAKGTRSKKSKASSSEIEGSAGESGVAADRIRRKEREFDLITLDEAAGELGKTPAQILDLAFREKIAMAILTGSGKPLFIAAKDVHRFMVDPQAKALVSDFKVSVSPQCGSSVTAPGAPLVFPPEPETEVSILTLRVLRDDVLRFKKESQTARREGEVLRIDLRTGEIFYKGLGVDVTDTPFRLLEVLARSPGLLIPTDTLITKASRYRRGVEINPVQWTKNHKMILMKALRKLVGRKRITREEIDGLITARRGCLRLNLAGDKIVFIEK